MRWYSLVAKIETTMVVLMVFMRLTYFSIRLYGVEILHSQQLVPGE